MRHDREQRRRQREEQLRAELEEYRAWVMLGRVKGSMLFIGAFVLALMVWPYGPMVSLIALVAWGGGGYALLTRGQRRPMRRELKRFARKQEEASQQTCKS
jgi:uncharacterized membrane protein